MKIIGLGASILLGALLILVFSCGEGREIPLHPPVLIAPDPGVTVDQLILPEPFVPPAEREYAELDPEYMRVIAEAHGMTHDFIVHQLAFQAGGNDKRDVYEIDVIYVPDLILYISTEYVQNDPHIVMELGGATYSMHQVGYDGI